VDYVVNNVEMNKRVVVVAASTHVAKKARRFLTSLQRSRPDLDTEFGAFIRADPVSTSQPIAPSEFLGNVTGADVFVIDDIVGKLLVFLLSSFTWIKIVCMHVDTAGTLSTLCRQMSREGADKVYLVASHGVFASNCMELIDLSPVDRVIVTDSVQLPDNTLVSPKIVHVSVADGLARIIASELLHMSYIHTNSDDEDYTME
jgi:phosphoribosylpyrophosphate synthetase